MNESGPSIAVSALTKRFGGVIAVDNVDLAIARGEIFGLVGPDGAGKTTILRMLAAVMAPDGGQVQVDGIDVVARPEQIRERISYMPQRFGLYEDLTVDENIRFYADLFGVARKLREERAERLLAASSMQHFRKRLAGQLSGGMKQKLGLACSLVHAPRIVLLDEPTTGVDPLSRREFWQILYSLRAEGVTLMISTAYLDEAERCDRLALLHGGRMLYCDTPAGLRARMPGVLVEFSTPAARPLRDAVRTQPGVLNVLLMGNGVHVRMDDASRLGEIEAQLHKQGVPYDTARRVTPSIEDLFVALLGEGDGHA